MAKKKRKPSGDQPQRRKPTAGPGLPDRRTMERVLSQMVGGMHGPGCHATPLAMGRTPAADHMLEAAQKHWPDLLRAYKQFEDQKPIVLFDLQEQRIYVYSYEGFKSELSERSEASLTEQYEKAMQENQIVVFVRDNVQRRLTSFSMDYE